MAVVSPSGQSRSPWPPERAFGALAPPDFESLTVVFALGALAGEEDEPYATEIGVATTTAAIVARSSRLMHKFYTLGRQKTKSSTPPETLRATPVT